MTNLQQEKWAIVQHSGFGYKGNPQFKKAVETRKLQTVGEQRLVERCGGAVFDSYLDAEHFAEKANYPDPDYKGIVPNAKGEFSRMCIDGLRIYIPVRIGPIA